MKKFLITVAACFTAIVLFLVLVGVVIAGVGAQAEKEVNKYNACNAAVDKKYSPLSDKSKTEKEKCWEQFSR
jgi:hypothetical protein